MKLSIIVELAATATNKAAKGKKEKQENIIMISSFSCFAVWLLLFLAAKAIAAK
ncbi:MAG: hypothetical protein GTO45_00980 [Candidatus Aminicenantes bacterium]|nr:hypothetical protein [Candidatus Aminicenantes bacterium]NIM77340.1 hypothetical protein [Candidatus Aminicenantes bacterium]NIN16638.1 hypothetical protein [Candidatus Aminicenantes bacterium]NIN40496.1 hypothetical protein [Candidatus Aminicenantes bacterium]NIN83316.1 hypothetical protein [Candidatus Aminicenantes bacterium]